MRALLIAAVITLLASLPAAAQIEFLPEGVRTAQKVKRAKKTPAPSAIPADPASITTDAVPPAVRSKPLPAQTIRPADDASMQFEIARSAVAGCEPDCPEWIAAQGRIDDTSPQRLRKLLKSLGARSLPVFVDSSGGSVDAALAMARLIRSKSLDVAVVRTEFEVCAPADTACLLKVKAAGARPAKPIAARAKCASACVFVLAGGTRRFADNRALIGVHQFKTVQTRVLRTYRVQQSPFWSDAKPKKTLISEKYFAPKSREAGVGDKTYIKVQKFLAEMGIGQGLMALIHSAPNSSVRIVNYDELRELALITDWPEASTLVAGGVAPAMNAVLPVEGIAREGTMPALDLKPGYDGETPSLLFMVPSDAAAASAPAAGPATTEAKKN